MKTHSPNLYLPMFVRDPQHCVKCPYWERDGRIRLLRGYPIVSCGLDPDDRCPNRYVADPLPAEVRDDG